MPVGLMASACLSSFSASRRLQSPPASPAPGSRGAQAGVGRAFQRLGILLDGDLELGLGLLHQTKGAEAAPGPRPGALDDGGPDQQIGAKCLLGARPIGLGTQALQAALPGFSGLLVLAVGPPPEWWAGIGGLGQTACQQASQGEQQGP